MRASAWALRARVTLLHCTTEYPAPVDQTNLAAMATMRAAFGLEVGYSDHTEGLEVSLAAVALGARVIEKHFTLDRGAEGPDHAASIEPDQKAALVEGAAKVVAALGTGLKQPGPAEARNIPVVRKSLCAARDLPAGHVLTAGDVALLRPGTGRAPLEYWDVLGTVTTRAHAKGEARE